MEGVFGVRALADPRLPQPPLPKLPAIPLPGTGPRNLSAEYAVRELRRAAAEAQAKRAAACQYPLACRHCSYRGRTEWPLDAGNWECPVCGRMQEDARI